MSTSATSQENDDKPVRASLFLTCLVDALFPDVGKAVVKVLRHFGVVVDFPQAQTCCGQPAFNAGFRSSARQLARHFLSTFEDSEHIVCPSGSCVSMVREHFPTLFAGEPDLACRVREVGARTREFTQFLTEVLEVKELDGKLAGAVTWHDSCHALRSLGIRDAPRRLLDSLDGIELRELAGADVCCGFGGLFSVKMEAIALAMLEDKIAAIEGCGASCVSATDSSCLAHIDGGLRRRGSAVRVRHVAEILAEALE